MSRIVNYRSKRPEEVRRRQLEVQDATIYLLKEYGPTSFLLQDERHRKFKVHIGEEHSCSCAIFRATNEFCVHLCWLLLKRFKVDVDDPVSWQLGLVEREVIDILDGKHSRGGAVPKNTDGDQPTEPTEAQENGELKQRRIEPKDICSICQDDLLGQQRLPITYCRRGCGNSVHIRCMRVWTDHQRKQKSLGLSEQIPCPICRQDFAPLGLLMRELTEDCRARSASKHSRSTIGKVANVVPLQPAIKPQHPATQCMNCQTAPIFGKVYKCQTCVEEDEESTLIGQFLLCADCFRTNEHGQHTRFMWREDPQRKWQEVGPNRCIPVNLGHSLEKKYSYAGDKNGSPSWQKIGGGVDTLTTSDLTKLPTWVIRVPRSRYAGGGSLRESSKTQGFNSNQRSSRTMDDVMGEIEAVAEMGRMAGTRARVENWGTLKTTGLLAPGRQCRICMMAYQIGQGVRRLQPGCQHIFHSACIDSWLLHQSATCPLDGMRVTPTTAPAKKASLELSYLSNRTQTGLEDIRICASAFGTRIPKPAPKAQFLASPRKNSTDIHPAMSSPTGMGNNVADKLSVIGQHMLTVAQVPFSAPRSRGMAARSSRIRSGWPSQVNIAFEHP